MSRERALILSRTGIIGRTQLEPPLDFLLRISHRGMARPTFGRNTTCIPLVCCLGDNRLRVSTPHDAFLQKANDEVGPGRLRLRQPTTRPVMHNIGLIRSFCTLAFLPISRIIIFHGPSPVAAACPGRFFFVWVLAIQRAENSGANNRG